MDIKNELNSSQDLSVIIKNLHEEQKNLNKKIHIFNILKLVEDIITLPYLEAFKEGDVHNAVISYQYDNEDDEYYLCLDFINNTENNLSRSLAGELRSECMFPGAINRSDINEEFNPEEKHFLAFDEFLKEKLLNLLLSKELKNILDYSQLDNDLMKKENTIKKHKL